MIRTRAKKQEGRTLADSLRIAVTHTDATQQGYATIELECLAIVWAIQKCDYYLRGIWTDHRPLVGIFDKALAALENARLMRMREKIIPFTFKITWVAGKTHVPYSG